MHRKLAQVCVFGSLVLGSAFFSLSCLPYRETTQPPWVAAVFTAKDRAPEERLCFWAIFADCLSTGDVEIRCNGVLILPGQFTKWHHDYHSRWAIPFVFDRSELPARIRVTAGEMTWDTEVKEEDLLQGIWHLEVYTNANCDELRFYTGPHLRVGMI